MGFPFVPLVVQLDIEAAFVKEAFDHLAQIKVASQVKQFLDHFAVLDGIIESVEIRESCSSY